MDIPTEIIGALLGVLGVILSAFLGAFLYKGKLRKEQKAKVKSMIGESIFKSLTEYKNKMKKLDVIAQAFPEEEYQEEKADFFDSFAIIPEIMLSPENIDNFVSDISNLRTNDFDNLGLDTGATLYCLERYFMNLTRYLSKLHPDQFSLVGTVLINDFQKFYTCITKLIHKELNQTRVRYVSHNGFFWERKKKKYQRELWEKSFLYSLINPDQSQLPKGREIIKLMSLAISEGARLSNSDTASEKPDPYASKIKEILNEEMNIKKDS